MQSEGPGTSSSLTRTHSALSEQLAHIYPKGTAEATLTPRSHLLGVLPGTRTLHFIQLHLGRSSALKRFEIVFETKANSPVRRG